MIFAPKPGVSDLWSKLTPLRVVPSSDTTAYPQIGPHSPLPSRRIAVPFEPSAQMTRYCLPSSERGSARFANAATAFERSMSWPAARRICWHFSACLFWSRRGFNPVETNVSTTAITTTNAVMYRKM